MLKNFLKLQPEPIRFGTDGWRGVLGVDITLERLIRVAIAASQELAYRAPSGLSKKIIIGYDRRFLACEFAEAITSAVRACNLQPIISSTAVTTPACSWAVVKHQALGALVITASHNPPEWLGLKIKGHLGASVDSDFTKSVESRLSAGGITIPIKGITEKFDCRREHLDGLSQVFDCQVLIERLREMGMQVIVDSMHGSAAGCIQELFSEYSNDCFQEIRSNRDTLFGGNSPEPLARNLEQLILKVKASTSCGKPAIGLVFDGDGDRIAAIDERGRFCSNQLLLPLLIEHMSTVRQSPGRVVKTVSGSDLMTLVAEHFGREVIELPVGFKYIAAEMLNNKVLIGGEESGGIGVGDHIPERDALYVALLLLETIAYKGIPLGSRLDELQQRFGKSFYDRIDMRLEDDDSRNKLEELLEKTPPKFVLNDVVQKVISLDGFKLILGERHWLMFRFSGTEPLLRIYCEAPTRKGVDLTLNWAREFVEKA
ncbi:MULTISPECIES: phosphoglucosamine mutase [Prochlorococcus]|uniref:phosphoglucosamine mutase n=1 Tax=Prochlorococcus TaxID=1218 RepID=UPI00053370F2|nr:MULTISPECIES: phosphoglucosamine mutase [Prochlorococcus]KGG13085.1 Phosphoglucosamine mutase [Prochlorococcus sp. MIT 0601]